MLVRFLKITRRIKVCVYILLVSMTALSGPAVDKADRNTC